MLGRIADHPINRIDELLLWKWAPLASWDGRTTVA
jgi:hypothetical protein